jgi:hypothetical protein
MHLVNCTVDLTESLKFKLNFFNDYSLHKSYIKKCLGI